jgi:hypothetical protein
MVAATIAALSAPFRARATIEVAPTAAAVAPTVTAAVTPTVTAAWPPAESTASARTTSETSAASSAAAATKVTRPTSRGSAWSALHLGLRFIHHHVPTFKVLAIQRCNRGGPSFFFSHVDEAKTSRAPRLSVGTYEDIQHFTMNGKDFPERVRSGLVTEIADVDPKHAQETKSPWADC